MPNVRFKNDLGLQNWKDPRTKAYPFESIDGARCPPIDSIANVDALKEFACACCAVMAPVSKETAKKKK